jgi:hypothetical protein
MLPCRRCGAGIRGTGHGARGAGHGARGAGARGAGARGAGRGARGAGRGAPGHEAPGHEALERTWGRRYAMGPTYTSGSQVNEVALGGYGDCWGGTEAGGEGV